MDIFGRVEPRFGKVKDAFARNFAEGQERGARFSLVIDGAVQADLWAGVMDRDGQKPFDDKTLTCIFSTTKAVAAIMMARLVDQGKLDYEQSVASISPDFAQGGKAGITVGQLLSHQAGLSGFKPAQDPSIWFEPEAVVRLLCAQAPLWPLGEGSGYHPIAAGYLVAEIFRRQDGRSMGTALREDFASLIGADLMIGTSESEFWRIADMQKPPAAPDLGVIDPIKQAAFLDKGSNPGGRSSAEWRVLEVPSANGHATALALAKYLGIVAGNGQVAGQSILSSGALNQLTRERVFGQDKVVPFRVSWAAGLMRNKGLNIYGPNERSVGHSGWGGSCAMADADKKLSCAYVMNKQSAHLIGDPRAVNLINAVYACL